MGKILVECPARCTGELTLCVPAFHQAHVYLLGMQILQEQIFAKVAL